MLPYSIGSVIRQTYRDWELLVVGDGCTDDSEDVVRRIVDPRVSWVNLPRNTGHQSGPNAEAARLARGELIAYLGHDDLWLPHHLALLVSAVDRGAGFAYGIAAMVSADGADVEPVPRGLGAYRPGLWIPPTAVVHRLEVLTLAGGWPHPRDCTRDPETELWGRMAATGLPFAFVRRLTAVKFPAANRRGVYRARPCHEQAAWFERIGREPEFEAVELAGMLGQAVSPRRILRRQWSRVTARLWRAALGYERGVFRRNRRRKGLGPPP